MSTEDIIGEIVRKLRLAVANEIFSRHNAGESFESIAHDFGITVEQAIYCEQWWWENTNARRKRDMGVRDFGCIEPESYKISKGG